MLVSTTQFAKRSSEILGVVRGQSPRYGFGVIRGWIRATRWMVYPPL
ncbi:hypothetical protein [Morococcus cerebrosus]|nr:hypothetical protein [Morococcus cerebrosus]MDU4437515.1 hypothetical protein [Neisseria sp.]